MRLFGKRAAASEYGAAYLEHNIPGRPIRPARPRVAAFVKKFMPMCGNCVATCSMI